MSKAYLLLPVHNRRQITEKCIDCLLVQSYDDYQLILLDDGSSDGTAEMVRNKIPCAVVLRGDGSWWWGGALHEGYRWLLTQRVPLTDFVVILNDDTEFDSQFLAKGIDFIKRNPRTLLMGTCYEKNTGRLFDQGTHVDWRKFTFEQAGSQAEVNCLATRGLFLTMKDFLEIGGFYPKLIPHYLSDYEFTIRAHRKGMRLCTTPSVSLVVDSLTTGLQIVDVATVKGATRSLCSIKSANNVKSWTFFILLACPVMQAPLNLARLYLHAFKVVLSCLKSRTILKPS